MVTTGERLHGGWPYAWATLTDLEPETLRPVTKESRDHERRDPIETPVRPSPDAASAAVNQTASHTTFNAPLARSTPRSPRVLEQELGRQRDYLEMIASENFVPRAVLESQGSVLTNKYAEGYPGRRYYGGCEFVDIAENLAIERAKTLFGADFANVQPHSGAQANAAVLPAIAARRHDPRPRARRTAATSPTA